jgi:8-oxo-dGTP pyrophosphatase MutT (NUDIX family)
MLRRAERDGDLRSGVAVFPGGVVDAQDHEAHACLLGPDDATASQALGLAQGGLDYWIAALRETFEEVGLLLADRTLEPALMQPWRDCLQQGRCSIAQMCREVGLRLDGRELVYFSHWLTPPGHPKRFDTRFFLVQAPPDQVAEADLGEALELMWLTPHQAMDPTRQLKLLPVTRRTLQELGQSTTVAEALAGGPRPHPDRTDHAPRGTLGPRVRASCCPTNRPTRKWPAWTRKAARTSAANCCRGRPCACRTACGASRRPTAAS